MCTVCGHPTTTNWEYMCTVCGHPTTTNWDYMCTVSHYYELGVHMRTVCDSGNYFTMYKIVAVLAFPAVTATILCACTVWGHPTTSHYFMMYKKE